MGRGIAQVCAAQGLEVVLWDLDEAQLKAQLSELNNHFEGMDFTFEMPHIEFVPGDGDGEDIVVIEGAPDGRFFERENNQIRFAPHGDSKSFVFPGGQGEVRFGVATPAPSDPARLEEFIAGRNSNTDARLDKLEARMERIERMLEKIAERID